MRRLAASMLDQLRGLYGPEGTHAHTPYFHGKPFLTQPVVEAVLKYDFFLDPEVADELVDFIQEQASVKVALKFEDIVQHRTDDIDDLFGSFFNSRGMADDPLVGEFMTFVRHDLAKAWEREFPEVPPEPETKHDQPVTTEQPQPAAAHKPPEEQIGVLRDKPIRTIPLLRAPGQTKAPPQGPNPPAPTRQPAPPSASGLNIKRKYYGEDDF